ncbi:MAG TPA: dienelactone hydrolase family protein [Patescibacteria group bacterium]|nr:dienelactone hydrolase family protein [Patescibacteria group bacterium]
MQKLNGPYIAPQSGTARQMVIFLHGYGSNGDDLIGIGHEWKAALPDCVFISPNAPAICDQYAQGFQWFPIRAIDPAAIEREEHAKNVLPVLNAFIDQELQKWGVDEAHLAVAGFSQGAMMAMYAMPRRKNPCAAVVGYSGMIIDAASLKAADNVKVPVLAVHGDMDDVVVPQNLEKIEAGFTAAGYDIETVMRPGLAHGIDQFGMIRGLEFIRENFEKAGNSQKKQLKA